MDNRFPKPESRLFSLPSFGVYEVQARACELFPWQVHVDVECQR